MGWSNQNILASVVIIEGPAGELLMYAPEGGAGNLIASIAAEDTTDFFGNAVLAGVTSYFQYGSGSWIAASLGGGGILWYFASSEEGPWTASATFQLNLYSNDSVAIPTTSSGISFVQGIDGTQLGVILAPSGDTTGIADRTRINFFLSASPAVAVTLLQGSWYIDQPIVMNKSGQVLQGSGWNRTIINCAFTAQPTWPNNAMLITGESVIVTQPVVRDLTLDIGSNVNCLHGWILRAEVPYGSNVEVKNVSDLGVTPVVNGPTYYGDMFHFSPSDVTAMVRDTYEMYNLFGETSAAPSTPYPAFSSATSYMVNNIVTYQGYVYQCILNNPATSSPPTGGQTSNSFWSYLNVVGAFGGNGLYLDQLVTSSEYFGCHFSGVAALPAQGAAYGIYDTGDANKFYGCHCYGWIAGAYINASVTGGPQIIGGEYENCTGPNVTFNGTRRGRVNGAELYGTHNTGTDMVLMNTASYNTIDGVNWNSSAVTLLVSGDGTSDHNSIVNNKSFVAIAAAVDFAAGANFNIITLNDFQGGTITHSGANDVVPAGTNL